MSTHGLQIVSHVLGYFDTYKRIAQGHNDHNAVKHFEHCWCVVAEAYFGRVAPGRCPLISTATPVCELPAPSIRPRWHIDKYSHPMRKVTDTRIDNVTGRVTHTLSCGHDYEDFAILPDAPPARCRRCRECKPQSNPAKMENWRDPKVLRKAVKP